MFAALVYDAGKAAAAHFFIREAGADYHGVNIGWLFEMVENGDAADLLCRTDEKGTSWS